MAKKIKEETGVNGIDRWTSNGYGIVMKKEKKDEKDEEKDELRRYLKGDKDGR